MPLKKFIEQGNFKSKESAKKAYKAYLAKKNKGKKK